MKTIPKTRVEADGDRARYMLSRMKPYKQWIRTAGRENLQSVTRVFGSPLAFYEGFVKALTELADHPEQTVIHVRRRGKARH